MSLQNLQVEFADSIFSNTAHKDLVTQSEHLKIYKNNVCSTLLKTLHEIYPLIHQLLGDDFFKQTALEYILNYPSCSGNLHDYGEYFADFLAEYAPIKNLIYLSEVAKFEWVCNGLHFAADHTPLNLEALAEIPPEEHDALHFTLHPASHLMKFVYPILQIIDLCKGLIEDDIHLDMGGVNLLLIRRNDDVMLITLPDADYAFLSQLHEGQTLAQALLVATQIDPDFKLECKLPGWIQDKTLVDCYVTP